jgi:laccase
LLPFGAGFSTFDVIPGKTYLLRLVNAALNTHLWFSVANHTLEVVGADGSYTYPFETSLVFLSPGQTTDVLITADQNGGTYEISASIYGREDAPLTRPVAYLQYPYPSPLSDFPFKPFLPAYNDTGVQFAFANNLRTLNAGRVPLTVNRNLFITIGITDRLCTDQPVAPICDGISPPFRAQAALNNLTFQIPHTALLQADYFNISGVFTETFPDNPPNVFDYTAPGSPPAPLRVSNYGTRIIGINFNDTVQVVLQDTNQGGFENHPFHLHGHNFYILGQGFGTYDPSIDGSNSLNLYDPPLRNTVSVPYRGWAVIRIKMNNPGKHLATNSHCSSICTVHFSFGVYLNYFNIILKLQQCSAVII